MAIKKTIKEPNGVTLSYHRIALVNAQVNQQFTILVESYIDDTCRQYEKDYINGMIDGEPIFPYTKSEYISFDYNSYPDIFSGNVIVKAYEWLKMQEKYKDATDIWEVIREW